MSTENKRTALYVATVQAKGEFDFLTEKIESELKWLDSDIRSLRRDIEKGDYYEATNLVSTAANVARMATRLKYAAENIETFKTLKEEQDKK